MLQWMRPSCWFQSLPSVGELNKEFEGARAAATKARIEREHTFNLLCGKMTIRKAKETEIRTAQLELSALQHNNESQVEALTENEKLQP